MSKQIPAPSVLSSIYLYIRRAAASRLAALLIARIFPICSHFAPGHPGASAALGVQVYRTQDTSKRALSLFGVSAAILVALTIRGLAQTWSFDVTDLSDRESLTILVLGDGGTGREGQFRVGRAMFDVCERRGCDLGVLLGDNIYENGIEVDTRDDDRASLRDILGQFDAKFADPYAAFTALPGFHFWVSLGNHDYRRNASGAMVTYSEFSDLWRMPALHYEIPRLPEWVQVHAVHTDTDVRRDLNGMQVESIRRRMCDESGAARWKVLFGHQPVYNSGHHQDDANEQRTRALIEQPPDPRVRRALLSGRSRPPPGTPHGSWIRAGRTRSRGEGQGAQPAPARVTRAAALLLAHFRVRRTPARPHCGQARLLRRPEHQRAGR